MDEEGPLEYCEVTVSAEGLARAEYKWAGLGVAGSQSHEEDVSQWSDDEIRECFADLLGIEDENDKAKIKVVWD